jgi:hypothetical protein
VDRIDAFLAQADEVLSLIETKDRVRTPEGARRYGEPIGAEIILNIPATVGETAMKRRAHDAEIQQYAWDHTPPEQRDRIVARTLDVRDKGKIAIAIEEAFFDVLDTGRFLNQFDTGTSMGTLDNEWRALAEETTFGIEPDAFASSRPIYGYVSEPGWELQHQVNQYGEIRVVLKDSVRNRTTMTAGDSLTTSAVPIPVVGDVTDRQVFNAIERSPKKDKPNGKITGINWDAGKYADENDKDTFYESWYYEAQIHGGVYLSDIDYVMLGDGYPQEYIDKAKKAAKKYGFTIRLYNESDFPEGKADQVLSLIEEKRVVRDAAYWGAPVGTPLPLRRKPTGSMFSMPSRNTFQYGTIEGPIHTTESRPGARVEMAFDDFDYWQGNYAIRTVSAQMMGIEGVQSYGDEVGPQEVVRAIDTGAINPGDFVHYDGDYNDPDRTAQWVVDKVSEHVNATWVLMQASKAAKPSTYPVYRGLAIGLGHPLLDAKPGDTITFPISAFAPDRLTAKSFGQSGVEDEIPVVLVLEKGARIVANTTDVSSVQNGRGGWVERPVEFVAQGKFEVVKTQTFPAPKYDNEFRVTIRQTHYFDIDSGEYVHV